ncbi:MAG: sigma-54 dependent transcriptional regulator [Bacteroidetes bacterium]|nr:sigma-54 dependent transcriptional regulator [Bacteroidota bacterium]
MRKILLIDDNQAVLNFLQIFFLQTGKYEVTTLQDSTKAYELIEKNEFDILLLDMDMPNVTGLDILKYMKEKEINLTTIVLTGVEDIDLAIAAMKHGTFDYMLKPIEEEKLLKNIENAISAKDIKTREIDLDQAYDLSLKNPEAFGGIITRDEKIIKIFHTVEKFAQTDNSVLIWGESGAGKELIAQAIHKISNRRDNKFVAVNAGAFAQELFSSEFFGHEKGAFTGASSTKTGFLEEANGGTLFLDEIGELSLPIQVKLLRVLQEEEFYKLGSTKNQKVDVRIIAATNKDLFEEIKEGHFRKDLFFRLNINSINLPPLRERKEDIELLAYHFLEVFNKKYGKNVGRITTPVLNCLKCYPFPGNVRELMNIINSSLIVESSNELRKKSLPNYFLDNNNNGYSDFDSDIVPPSLCEIEKKHIKIVLEYTNNNRSKASEILGISRVNLLSKIKKYELE